MSSTLTLPGARPYAYTFTLSTTAFIIINIQRNIVDPGGFGEIQCGNPDVFAKARSIVPRVQQVLDVFRSAGGHVIHTREGHQPNLSDIPAAKRLRQISAPHGHHSLGIGGRGPGGRRRGGGGGGRGSRDE